MKLNYKNALLLLFISVFLLSCREDDSHPITWHYWSNATKTQLLKFKSDGSWLDLYNMEKTKKNTFDADEEGLIMYRKTTYPPDTAVGHILLVNSDLLVIKFDSRKTIDTFKAAGRNEKIIGTWVPAIEKNTSDTFHFTDKEYFDSYKVSEENKSTLFRFNFINDSILELNYFETGNAVKYKYLLSQDARLLHLETEQNKYSLKRK